ncbi:MAG: imidazolonepropionase [Chitinophagia bacterium]|nr:imidazolonepropionase [Chitinophagia bacterium]
MKTLFYNIGVLAGIHEENQPLRGYQLADLPILHNAYLLVEDHTIHSFGSMNRLQELSTHTINKVDVAGGSLFPSWCDSHTHLVFAGSREAEFVDKIKGASYAEIAAKGGGILNSAKKVQLASEDELYTSALMRLRELVRMGTGAIEIKSGYGLTVEAELKMLRVIKRLQQNTPVTIKSTFLGAHAIPVEFANKREEYINIVTEEMLPIVAKEGLANFIDVFCETGFFSPTETKIICEKGKQLGLQPKIHANQLGNSGGVETGVAVGAISVDHLESMTEELIQLLASSSTIATLLPNASFFLRMQDAPARGLIDAGAVVALASDYNPGSAPSGNMNLVVSQSCIRMKMLPAEAINAATLNGAFAMGVGESCGSIKPGKLANFFITKPIPSIEFLPYAFGSLLIDKVVLRGKLIEQNSF